MGTYRGSEEKEAERDSGAAASEADVPPCTSLERAENETLFADLETTAAAASTASSSRVCFEYTPL